MKPYYSFLIVLLALKQAQAIWPFDSDSSSTDDSSASSTSTSTSDGGFFRFFGSGSSSTDSSSSSATSSASSSSDAASSTSDDSDSTGTDSSWYQVFLNSGGNEDDDGRNDYAPFNTTCPSHSITREASGISDQEKEYLVHRHASTNKNLIEFLLNKSNLSDFDAASFINDNADTHNITIGLSFSGGGYRAMLCGAGQILGMDGRYDGANDHGLGGLLESSTYVVGLSGGNWLVGLLVLNDWLSVADIVNGKSSIWQLEDSILNPSGIRIDKTIAYYYGLSKAVEAKEDAGFDTSITDTWGKALSYQFFEDGEGGPNVTWSSIRNISSFKDHLMPYPIVVANGRHPNTLIINENSTVFEVSPYELGSWDPSLRSFSDVQYLGSVVHDGDPNNTDVCVQNFDNAGFIMGTSSSLFNQVLLQLDNYSINSVIKLILQRILVNASKSEYDIAIYRPNPFFGAEAANAQSIVDNQTLYLCDGGEDLQNVPFYPLIQTARDVDVIFAFDNSADTNHSWPNGTSIMETYKRQFSKQGKGTPFPFAPDVDGFLDDDLGAKPVFFGCNASDLADLAAWHESDDINATDIPLVVYTSNARMSYNSNFSTFKLSYSDEEKLGAIRNGFEVVTRNNLTDDDDWLTCVGCAIIRRQQERLGHEQSDECKRCFQEYCWTGGLKEAASVSSVTDIAGLATASGSSSSGSRTSSSSGSSNTGSGGGGGSGSGSGSSMTTSTITGSSAENSGSSLSSTSSETLNGGGAGMTLGTTSYFLVLIHCLVGLVFM
ncbi:Lysophospholipase 3 [Candida viswanathii]|uniref:Lysophospholipase n=1 Tax=Candida viswanathii TaxID=5486 RepID=A0A367YKA3_9ASCO|nr:Lysophospholipase 3 [Candida viswanathii]